MGRNFLRYRRNDGTSTRFWFRILDYGRNAIGGHLALLSILWASFMDPEAGSQKILFRQICTFKW